MKNYKIGYKEERQNKSPKQQEEKYVDLSIYQPSKINLKKMIRALALTLILHDAWRNRMVT